MYRLREWEPRDADRVLSAFADPELRTQEAKVPSDLGEALEWIARRAELAVERQVYGFAIVEGSGPPLGHVQVEVTSRRHEWGWVSYWTHGEARGKVWPRPGRVWWRSSRSPSWDSSGWNWGTG